MEEYTTTRLLTFKQNHNKTRYAYRYFWQADHSPSQLLQHTIHLDHFTAPSWQHIPPPPPTPPTPLHQPLPFPLPRIPSPSPPLTFSLYPFLPSIPPTSTSSPSPPSSTPPLPSPYIHSPLPLLLPPSIHSIPSPPPISTPPLPIYPLLMQMHTPLLPTCKPWWHHIIKQLW